MGKPIREASRSARERFKGRHRFEHWYVDNQVYFITARVRDRFAAFDTEPAKSIFWDRFSYYTARFTFAPFITSLLNNHYHTLGYLRIGLNLKLMMQRVYGSVAKLVNDLLGESYPSFWRDQKGREYFDGCIRNEKQCRLTYRYILTQSQRHHVCADDHEYPHTRIDIDLDRAIARAHELHAFLEDVPYPRLAP